MKLSLWISGLFFLLTLIAPQKSYAVIAKPKPIEVTTQRQEQVAKVKTSMRLSVREKIGRKFNKFKQRVRQWKAAILMSFPSGKLLTSLIFLVLSIVFFAVAGATTLAVWFNILGSAAVIAALLFFILWLSGRGSLTNTNN